MKPWPLALVAASLVADAAVPRVRGSTPPTEAILGVPATPVSLRTTGDDTATALLRDGDAWLVLVVRGDKVLGPTPVAFPAGAAVRHVAVDADGSVWGTEDAGTVAWRWTPEAVTEVPLPGCATPCAVRGLASGLTAGPQGATRVRLGQDLVVYGDTLKGPAAPAFARTDAGGWSIPDLVGAEDLAGCDDTLVPDGAVLDATHVVTVLDCAGGTRVQWHGALSATWIPHAPGRVLVRPAPDGRLYAVTVADTQTTTEDLGPGAPAPLTMGVRWMPAGPALAWPQPAPRRTDIVPVSRLTWTLGAEVQVVDVVVTDHRVVALAQVETEHGLRPAILHGARLPVLPPAQ